MRRLSEDRLASIAPKSAGVSDEITLCVLYAVLERAQRAAKQTSRMAIPCCGNWGWSRSLHGFGEYDAKVHFLASQRLAESIEGNQKSDSTENPSESEVRHYDES